MSGVSVRTLHFYDEAGLLKPARYGVNGYRYYEEPQLFRLQQILFYRELGFELQQIRKILDRDDFEKVEALKSHRQHLQGNLERTTRLIATIDKTIECLKGKLKMKNEELFAGFSPEEQSRHENYLIDRYSEPMKKEIARSRAKVKNWTRADWQKSGDAFADICRDLASAMKQKLTADAAEVQNIIRRHHGWLKQFWQPVRQSYIGYGQLVVDSELRQAYAVYDAALPEFAASAMRVFAENELA